MGGYLIAFYQVICNLIYKFPYQVLLFSSQLRTEDNREVGEPLVEITSSKSNAAPATVIGEIRLTTVKVLYIHGKGMNQVCV
jgi:hypothetical protein